MIFIIPEEECNSINLVQDIFSSFLAPVLLDDVGCEQALLLGIGRRKKSELKTRDDKKGEGKKG